MPDADYAARNIEPFEGMCDACAERAKPIVHVDEDTSAYICEGCITLEEQAIRAVAEALSCVPDSDIPLFEMEATPLEVARIAVNAYVMAKWRNAEQCDGQGASDAD